MMPVVQHTPTMVALRPFWGRVTVLPSPVDEVERESGVIVPLGREHSDYDRGIVLHVATCGIMADALDILQEGMVVYYEHGATIGDVIVVNISDVVAYIEDS